VSFGQEALLRKLAELADLAGRPDRYVIALSGGLDSTVLTHALATAHDERSTPVLAVYVDHGLQKESAVWSRHCAAFAATLGIEFLSVQADVDEHSGTGPEAAAREGRYAVLQTLIRTGDWLLSAHHKDDQAETLLLNLMRGSGPAGLAGIAEVRPFSVAWLVRPLLSVSQRELRDYATEHELDWIDDPSNQDRHFDRNYLRHEVMPRLEARWPDVASRLRRSALLAGEASQMLDHLADADLRTLGDRPDRLALDELRDLPSERQRNVLRYVVRELGLPSPPATQLHSIVSDLIPARDDASPVVAWKGADVRRYRDNVYVLPAATRDAADAGSQTVINGHVKLASGLGELSLEPGAGSGLAEKVVAHGLEVRYRSGGEEIQPLITAGRRHRSLDAGSSAVAVFRWPTRCGWRLVDCCRCGQRAGHRDPMAKSPRDSLTWPPNIRCVLQGVLVTFKTVFSPTTASISKGWRKALSLLFRCF